MNERMNHCGRPLSLGWPAEPAITSSQCYPAGISSPRLCLKALGPKGHLPPSPGPYPDPEGRSAVVYNQPHLLPFCFSHDTSTATRRREGMLSEVLGLVIKTHPGDLCEAGPASLVEAEMSFPKGCCRKQEKPGETSWLKNYTSQIRNVSVTI